MGEGVRRLPGHEQQCRITPARRAKTLPRREYVGVDGMKGDAQTLGNFLAVQMFGDKAQHVALPLRKGLECVVVGVVRQKPPSPGRQSRGESVV